MALNQEFSKAPTLRYFQILHTSFFFRGGGLVGERSEAKVGERSEAKLRSNFHYSIFKK